MKPAQGFIIVVVFLFLFLFPSLLTQPAYADWTFDPAPPITTILNPSNCVQNGENFACSNSTSFDITCSDPALSDGTPGSGCFYTYYHLNSYGAVSCPPSQPGESAAPGYQFGTSVSTSPISGYPQQTLCAYSADGAGNISSPIARALITFVSDITVTVFNDLNLNGIDDDGAGYQGAPIHISAGPSTPADQTTGSNGQTTFSNLLSGSYTATLYVPAGWIATSGSCSPNCTSTSSIYSISIPPSTTVKFGIAQGQTISGSVYFDSNGSGTINGDPFLNADGSSTTRITLTGTRNFDGAAVNTYVDTGNIYSFAGVFPGNYTLTPTLGSYKTVVPATRSVAITTANSTGNDFLFTGWSITTNVFIDYDHNGANDGSDGNYTSGASSLSISPSATCTNNGAGCTYSNIRPGSYQITLTVPNRYQATTYTSNCNPVSCRSSGGVTATTYTTAGVGPDQSINPGFGITPVYTISGTLYYDGDDDGVNDDSTFFDDSANIDLLNSVGAVSQTVGATRTYSFDVVSGTYTVRAKQNSGYKTAYALISPPTGTLCPIVTACDFPLGFVNTDRTLIDFLFGGWTISGTSYVDFNHNGVSDASDGDTNYTGGATVSLAGRTPKSPTTTSIANPYTYIFTGLRPATYTVTLTYPNGYTGSSSNPLVRAVGPLDQTASFYITPYYTISGNVWIDTDKNEIKAGESNYTGPVVMSSGGSGVISYPAAGAYKISQLISGPYTVTCTTGCPPDTYILTYPRGATGNPSFRVQVGKPGTSIACGLIDVHNTATCYEDLTTPPNAPYNGDIQDVNFGITKSIQWFQGKGGDMRNDSGFTDPIPTDLSTYASLDGLGGMPGVIFSGDGSYNFCSGANSSGGNCRAKSSTKQWIAGDQRTNPATTYTALFKASAPDRTIHTSYDYLIGRLASNPQIIVNTLPSSCSDPAGCSLSSLAKGVWKSDSSITVTASNLAGGNYVFLVDGDIRITGRITTPLGNTSVFSASNDIIIDKTLGQNPNDTTTTIEGIYSADRFFNAENVGGFNCATPEPDKRLNIAGVVIANAARGGGGPDLLDRDMCDSNLQYPSIYFDERPDMLLNLPELLLVPNVIWREIAP